MNLNNFLLDEKENSYVIGCLETHPRNIVYNFARWEPLISIQMTRLDKPDNMVCLLEFLAGLMEVSPLSGDLPRLNSGMDRMVDETWQPIRVLRDYARRLMAGRISRCSVGFRC